MFWPFLQKKNLSLGEEGEREAAKFLQKKGYRIIGRNVYNTKGRRLGEIDLICRDRSGTLVFVEVKTRWVSSSKETLPPELALTPQKMRRLERIAHYLLQERGWENIPYRFEAVAVEGEECDGKRIFHCRHIENILF